MRKIKKFEAFWNKSDYVPMVPWTLTKVDTFIPPKEDPNFIEEIKQICMPLLDLGYEFKSSYYPPSAKKANTAYSFTFDIGFENIETNDEYLLAFGSSSRDIETQFNSLEKMSDQYGAKSKILKNISEILPEIYDRISDLKETAISISINYNLQVYIWVGTDRKIEIPKVPESEILRW